MAIAKINNYFISPRISMSKTILRIIRPVSVTAVVLLLASAVLPQVMSTTLTVSGRDSTVRVSGKFATAGRPGSRNFTLQDTYAGNTGLAGRFSGIRLLDREGNAIPFRQLIPGEFLAESPIDGFEYTVNITPKRQSTYAGHISWLKNEAGIIFIDDLLPQTGDARASARVKVDLDDGLSFVCSKKNVTPGSFITENIAHAVYYIGSKAAFRQSALNRDGAGICLAGRWGFSDEDAAIAANGIYWHYRNAFRRDSLPAPNIVIMPFPDTEPAGTWEADTRAGNITILSSDAKFVSQSLQRLHEQLRHEIFHLWFPGSLDLSGQYDWFYEGFALYRSLKAAVELGRIRFDDYLGTITNAYAIDRLETRRISLIDASRTRWGGSNTYLYARGLLAAFAIDLEIIKASRSKQNIDEIFRTLLVENEAFDSTGASPNANDAILGVMTRFNEIKPVVNDVINGSSPVELSRYLSGTGMQLTGDRAHDVGLKPDLDRREKAILDQLGYNSWRKLTGSKR